MEKTVSLTGLALLVVIVAVWKFGPDWGALLHTASHPTVPQDDTHTAYWYWAISLLGATITVYEPFFFSSGAIEEKWGREDLVVNRTNVYLGFPLGAVISLAIMALGAIYLFPRGIDVQHLSQSGLPVSAALGRAGVALFLVGAFAAVFSAALETALSSGYIVCQYFGWPWGKSQPPARAARFHLVIMLSIVGAVLLGISGVDPVKVTEYSIVLSAAALPLTYFPILVIANDVRYMGPDHTNGRALNVLATVYLVLLVAVSIAVIPLIIITKGGS
jgi:Mn2+/Fe2+ NRAMP family transporter